MAGAEAGVTVTEARELLAGCEAADTGCFGSDPEAYLAMQSRFLDVGDEITTLRMVQSVTEAGLARVAFEDAMYAPWALVPDDDARQAEAVRLAALGRRDADPGNPQKMVDGSQARVVEHLGPDTPDNRRAQIVRCAYVCGKTGIGNCPILRD